MRLPLPIHKADKIYTEIEVIKPKGSVIADTKKIADAGNVFSAMRTFISGCTEAIIMDAGDIIKDNVAIKQLVAAMPYRSAEWVSLKIMLGYDEDDGIEGIYKCPRCGKDLICELKKIGDEDVDTRDFISQLEVVYLEGGAKTFRVDLKEPFSIVEAGTRDVIQRIETLEMIHPTIANCEIAYSRFGQTDDVRLQFGIYAEALTHVNGVEVDAKFRNRYGTYIFENIRDIKHDLGAIQNEIKRYGLDPLVRKTCMACGKEWMVPVNTSNFFASGLRPL